MPDEGPRGSVAEAPSRRAAARAAAAKAPEIRTERPVGPIPAGGGGGRLFLLTLFFAAAILALYHYEAMSGVAPGTWEPVYFALGVLGMLSLILLWGGLRGRQQAARAIMQRAGDLVLSGLALERGEGKLVYANRVFLDLLSLCGAETKEEPDLWTLYVFRQESSAADLLTTLRQRALAGYAAHTEISIPRVGRAPLHYQVAVVPGSPGDIVWSCREISAIRERDTMSSALAGLRNQLETVPVGMAVLDAEGRVIECNPACRDLLGTEDPIGQSIVDFVKPADRLVIEQRLAGALDEAAMSVPVDVEMEGLGHRVASVYFSRRPTSADGSRGVALHLIDTTEKKKLEVQFSQSQKMQAVGQLAGGIAHDFNNLLTAMIGFCDLLLQRYQPGDPSFADIMQIKQNANRGARLVRQLLAFSRQQRLQPRVLDVTDVLTELSGLLHRLLGESIELRFIHGRDLGRVRVDQGQLEQVIINLAVNARDAMPRGGKLTIATRNSSLLSRIDRSHAEFMPPGEYLMIKVSDTGVGMSKELIARIFDPFFTTKEVGSGTGLGLATVYGIIKQTGGFIFADSDGVSKGSTFTIYLQRYDGPERSARVKALPEAAAPPPVQEQEQLSKGATILLVEDEDPVRLFGARALRSKGYRVIEARNGEIAIDLLNDEDIDLLITDMVMPRVDGQTLIAAARRKMPTLPVICISGYTQESVMREISSIKNVKFLAKPFSLKQLTTRVSEMLDSHAPADRTQGHAKP